MLSCPNCGTAVGDSEKFCPSCGASFPGEPEPAAAKNATEIAWSRVIPLATNRAVVKDIFLVLFAPAVIGGILFTLLTGAAEFLLVFLGIAVVLFIIGYIVMVVLQLGGKGGLNTYFYISNEGVAYQAGKGTILLNLASTVGSAASGSLAGTGVGLLAISAEANTFFWKDVRYIRVFEDLKMIQLRSRMLIQPIPLYCTDENYPVVLGMVRMYAPKSATIRNG